MNEVFADTCYWIALLDSRQSLHEEARAASQARQNRRIVTSEFVLMELMNFFGNKGPQLKGTVADLLEKLYADPNVTVVRATSSLFQKTKALFAERLDKEWGGVDCSSFCIMQARSIDEVLTEDHHFEQAGFTVLLKG